jgi:ATP phosphoribosyltransferase regulatory subunit
MMSRMTSRRRAPSRPGSKSQPRREAYGRSLVPIGMATILPHTAQRIRHLEDVLLTALGRWGYQEIIPPTFEYLDVLSEGLEPTLIEKSYKFADRTTGRILLLRPDVTAQIARIVAMGILGTSLPLRLSYRTTVFRHEPEHAGREREIFQVGAELIGQDDVTMDGEIIALMIECLKQLGLVDFKISLGHVGFFKALLVRSGMSREGRKRAERAAARKDLPRLEEILTEEHVSKQPAAAILEAPELYGREEVLKRGRVLARGDARLREPLDRLARLYQLLSASGLREHLLLDLGEFRGFDYYDGVVFDVFAGSLGCELGGGGRYNHLIGRFGRDLPSTGFALDVDRLFRALEPSVVGRSGEGSEMRVDFLVCGPLSAADRVLQVAQLLRQAGHRVIQAMLTGTSIPQAIQQARRASAAAVVMLGTSSLSSDQALVLTGYAPEQDPKSSGHGKAGTVVRRKMKVQDLPTMSLRVPSKSDNS